MTWYRIAILLGAVVAPWITSATMLKIAFEERGFLVGFGVWAGVAIVTTPIILAIMWLGRILF